MRKCINGLAQAARKYNKKAVEILKKVDFIRGNIDSCLYMKKSKKGIVCITLNVDDNLLIEKLEVIYEFVRLLQKNWLVLKVVDGFQDYFSCN